MFRLVVLLLVFGCYSPSPEELVAFNGADQETPTFDSDLLDLFTVPTEDDYTLGAGDLIAVDVWGHPDLSGQHVIGPDGRITLPTAGPMRCTGLTRTQAAEAIGEILASMYTNVSVTVRVEEYRSASVSVLGGVGTPGTYPFTTPPTLLRALSDAGGVVPLRNGLHPDRATIVRGKEQVAWIDLDELMAGGNPRLNVTLSRDDTVYVQDSSDTHVYVLGEVNRPGLHRLTPGMDLTDLVGRAGGFTVNAQPRDVRLLRSSNDTQIEVNYFAYAEGDYAGELPLRADDVLVVPRNGLAIFGYVLSQISPFSSVVVNTTTVGDEN